MAVFKTNAMRMLERSKIPYEHYEYDPEVTDGVTVAELVGQDKEMVFKTLVTVSSKGNYYVFVVPVGKTLDLKKAASVVGEKSVAMIKQKELLPLTGYIHGGCSPVGMKKLFPTVIHKSAEKFEKICVSAGQRGHQVKVPTAMLADAVKAKFAFLIAEE
ncbi:MAG: Cys-tRNA(Pro) deacylase [Clostridia bacterium]|nr:Cys-tRNA(Pro) deacylase [Clostridia bacterium]